MMTNDTKTGLLELVSEHTIKRTKVFFRDKSNGNIRTRVEYFDTPEIQKQKISYHIMDEDFHPFFWSVNGTTWYHTREYTYNNIKMVKFIENN